MRALPAPRGHRYRCPDMAHSGRAARADECLLLEGKADTDQELPISIYEYTT